jgi:glutathione S-transferase
MRQRKHLHRARLLAMGVSARCAAAVNTRGLQHFEAILAANGGTPDAPGFLVGRSRTAADLAVYHYLAAAQQHYGRWYAGIEAPICKAFQAAIARRPNIAAYLASPRCQPWDDDSMM